MTTKTGRGKPPAGGKAARGGATRKAAKLAPRSQPAAAKAPKKPVRVAAKPTPPKPKPRPEPSQAKPIVKARRAARRKELEPFRAMLLARQRELMQDYTLAKGDSRSHPDSGTEDYIDYAVSSYAKEFLLSLTEMDRKQILLVQEALGRIDRGEYGRCQQCGEEISRKRLEVAPWARYCIRCQDLEEQGLLPQYTARIVSDDAEGEEAEESPATEFEPEIEPEESEEIDEDSLGVDEGEAENLEDE